MRTALAAGLALTLAGCGGGEAGPADPGGSSAPPLPWPASVVPATPEPADNPGTPEKIDLGRLLFYDPILSSDQKVACATCHSEIWGMSDGLPRSIGVGGEGPTGPGRMGPSETRRNAQTLWNVAFRAHLFHDGRAASLEEQVLAPLHEKIELGRDPADLVADLAAIPGYAQRFSAAFPGEGEAVTVLHLQQAIAAFERTLRTDRSPYDHYVAGDLGALGDAAKRGMKLFAELGCAGCHVPPLFESDKFADRKVAPLPGVDDHGREEVTHDPADRDAYRVPTLRNIRESGPYFHTGAVEELRDAVAHEAALGPRPLTEDELDDLWAFLHKGLIDPSESPSRPVTVPSGLPVPEDGFRIPR
ncbi:MAG: cytochrome c peroxidase [Byssovorax sp.]